MERGHGSFDAIKLHGNNLVQHVLVDGLGASGMMNDAGEGLNNIGFVLFQVSVNDRLRLNAVTWRSVLSLVWRLAFSVALVDRAMDLRRISFCTSRESTASVCGP